MTEESSVNPGVANRVTDGESEFAAIIAANPRLRIAAKKLTGKTRTKKS